MTIEIIKLIGGLIALYFGAEALVVGASSTALRYGVKPLVVGLTIVAFGTSAPELLVSLWAVVQENDDISVGNIIGSNIANIALILGCASLVRPLEVHEAAVKREFPIMAAASVLMIVLALDQEISRIDGVILVVGMISYLLYSFYIAQREAKRRKQALAEEQLPEELQGLDPHKGSLGVDVLKVMVGIGILAAGAYLLVESATTIARALGVDELIIGISVVAIGTSLPELATSIVAAMRDESDISVGNVIGSNIFNLLMVLGLVACTVPIAVSGTAVRIDLWVMLGISLLVWPILRTGYRIARVEGAILLLFYIGYLVYLFMRGG